jgi:methionyl-tRNA synthetase
MHASAPAPLPATFFLTTAIDYVNAPPHLGHAYEKMACDTLARFYKLAGIPTFFLTGTDEHGIKIQKNAHQQGLSPQAFTDAMANHFKTCWHTCHVAYDDFVRTTQARHHHTVNELWQRLVAKGTIVKASYKARYCQGCEAFKTERELDENGQCPIHLTTPDWVEEENYFFKLSQYKEALLAHYHANPTFVWPTHRQAEVLNMLEELEDISVSRSKQAVSWGIPVPNDPDQVIYVWIDALSNYLTGLGYASPAADDPKGLYATYWTTRTGDPNAVHVIGKDILRFHAIYWPAMLLAADLPLPKQIVAHGFINLNDRKMGKSTGNTLAPQDVLQHFNLPTADALRYYLLAQTPFGNDGNFTLDEMKLRINADLANNLGNLLNRTLAMVKKYHQGCVPAVQAPPDEALQALLSPSPEVWQAMAEAYRGYGFHTVAELALARVDEANKLINEREPWTLYKNEQLAELATLMRALLEVLAQTAVVLSPIMPNLTLALWHQLGLSDEAWAAVSWETLGASPWQGGEPTSPTGPLLPRLDDDLVGAQGKGKN